MRIRWDKELAAAPWQTAAEPTEHWAKRLQAARSMPAAGIRIGTDINTGLPSFITPEILRTHMQVIGSTGVGKSFFLELLIKALILQGHGVTVIDPHGDLYHRILTFCTWLSIQRPDLQMHRRVIPFDVAETQNIIGFNPVGRNARVLTYQVVALMEAVKKCWGQNSFQETPRLARWLFNVSYALVSSGVTFIQAQNMVNAAPSPLRKAIANRIPNPRIQQEWEFFESLKLERREERIESTLNRIKPFVEHEIIRPMLGQYTNTINFPSIISDRRVLLVNLARQNVISDDNQSLLGTLVVNEELTAAFAAPANERVPHYLVIDEFSRFVTKDTCEILDGGRKYKLHLILAHQHLNQLKEKDPEVYFSTLTNARTKVVFGGLNDEDVELIAKELYTGELDPDEVKDEVWHRGFEPVESTRVVHAYSSSDSFGDSSGQVSHSSLTDSRTYIPGSNFWSMPTLSGTSRATGSGSSSSQSHQSSYSSGHTQTTVPFYEFHEYKELSSRAFRSLEEQLYRKKAQLKRQQNQRAAILIPGEDVCTMKVATLRELAATDKQEEEFRQRCMATAGFYKSPQLAEQEIAALEERLLAELNPPITIQALPAKVATIERKTPAQKPIWDRTGSKA